MWRRAAQPVSLYRGEARRNHGDLHRLLLEERDTIGAAQYFHHRRAKILDLLPALPAADERWTMPP